MPLAAILILAVTAALLVAVFARLASLFQEPPYVPIGKKTLPAIVAALDTKPEEIFMDLGCGDGRVLFAVHASSPETVCIGVERSLWPLCAARLRWHLAGRPERVRIIHGNFFAADVSRASKVFLFCMRGPMDALLPKFARELPPGALVVSADFAFSKKEPEQVIDLGGHWLGRTLRLYRF